ncbi:hypothetical protein CDO73_17440 [Saccharibacillus sp. O23]|uniref:GNAT family N-acetyltransferase n=1 Tax=Saccharibacillus sp. O23 TaxID=2009338 RepID=UPI000B4E6B7C|nr:GNAT family N-acetyltransferase [Saccharibacillus sp. O23]OWR28684.1 hypothetical protein CDO73_17440 [Saccharibacillus sp. O23]
MIIIKPLPTEAGQFRQYLPGLQNPLPPGATALAAELNGLFAGAAIVMAHPRSRAGSISVLHTPELFRNRGVGSRLLEEAERLLAEAGCLSCRVTLTLRLGVPSPEYEFLSRRGYDAETLLQRDYVIRSASLAEAPWMKRLKLPPRAKLEPLLPAAEEERREIERLAAALPPEQHPFDEERVLDDELGVMLKIGGRVAGWLGVQKLGSTLLAIRAVHVDPNVSLFGGAFALFAAADRELELTRRFAHLMFSVSGEYASTLRVCARKLGPHASSIKSLVRLEKKL